MPFTGASRVRVSKWKPYAHVKGNDRGFRAAENAAMEHFGIRFKRFRDARGWSQEQIGFELDVTKATISKWEAGLAQPRLENLAGIRRLVAEDGLTLEYLIEGVATDDAHVAEPAPAYRPGVVRNADEADLLARFRGLKPSQRKGLLALLGK
ncbi:helix-turn-helix domain-containing protein [Marilutibacter chinensis]|uniref:Helix-turn-helix domain-containing protein n=1 Tax=Marilutibacter chinensis TaxID=2912247 RepID=A0ABS9HU04_9GAMM|nr:helix-turn-helix transcriptional regulator [Lysobacter chinensis]MCF7221996.1 helix-turn-helix domain-containing protein [Lysobacter chinensis]